MSERDDLRAALGLDEEAATQASRAARAVAALDGAPSLRAEAMLLTLERALRCTPTSRPAPAPPSAAELGRAFPSPHARAALLHGLILIASIDGELSAAGATWIARMAEELGVKSAWVDLLPALGARRSGPVKRALLQRSPDARRILQRTWTEDGVRGVARALWFMTGRFVGPALARRFRDLATLPAGTFGRAFSDHLTARNLAFPGERGGMPEKHVHHDLMHVLNGYDTDAAGECEIASFYAGFAAGDAFAYLATALATFQLELPVSPAAVVPARGAFDAERMIRAFTRGRSLRVDVMGPWDYWALFPLPLGEAAARLGLPFP